MINLVLNVIADAYAHLVCCSSLSGRLMRRGLHYRRHLNPASDLFSEAEGGRGVAGAGASVAGLASV
jgi:hypothetical protein